MKTIVLLLATSAFAAPALAGSLDEVLPMEAAIVAPAASTFGGFVTGYYGGASVADDGCCDYDDPTYSYYGIEASLGGGLGGGRLGWQLDANYELGSDSADYYRAYGGTAHINFDLSGYKVGAFAGAGYQYNENGNDGGPGHWYGIEAARGFGNVAVAAQLGFASSDNDHDSLDYNNEFFGQVRAHYFLNDNIMITGNLGYGAGIIHSEPMDFAMYGVEGTMRLGQSNFYANAGYEGLWASEDNGTEDVTNESRFYVGVSMLFGGGSLRDIHTNSTPMIDNSFNNLLAVYTSTLD
ncbi:MAG: hypothetical protein GQ535_05555 [Rhodobacteraceae bacterium]|nr:hypothetical protein [Paracoccaceae bacterium]